MLKITRIKNIHFWLIAFIILLQPIIRQIKPLLFGDRYTGTVVEQCLINDVPGHSGYVKFSIIEFQIDSACCRVYGPANLEMETGKHVPLIVLQGNEDEVLIATFSGIFLQGRTAMVIIVLVIWIAIFLTMKQLQDNPGLGKKR